MKACIRSTLVFMTILLLNGCADLEENSRISKQNDYSPEGLQNLEVLSLNDQRLASALQSLDEQLSKKATMNQLPFEKVR